MATWNTLETHWKTIQNDPKPFENYTFLIIIYFSSKSANALCRSPQDLEDIFNSLVVSLGPGGSSALHNPMNRQKADKKLNRCS